ncbi:MAG: DUF2335 domain-containing protein [Thermoguttaceae bacterium]
MSKKKKPSKSGESALPVVTINQEARGQLIAAGRVSVAYSGPVPSPDTVEAYDRLSPGAADRFLAMAEREQKRRIQKDIAERESEKQRMDVAKTNYCRGLCASVVVLLSYFALMGVFGWLGVRGDVLFAMVSVPAMTAIAAVIRMFLGANRRNTER